MTHRWVAHHAEVLPLLRTLPDASFDACLTDVPYGIGDHQPTVEELIAYLRGAELDTGGDFMGRDWHVPSVPTWREILRVLKPGAPLASFAGARTGDLVSLGVRASGFEVRDTLMWLYGQGMPHGFEDGGAEGHGTTLKPAWEPIILARRPFAGTVQENLARWGVGVLAIDACRIGTSKEVPVSFSKHDLGRVNDDGWVPNRQHASGSDPNVGRWPSNVILDEDAAALLDEQSGERPSGKPTKGAAPTTKNTFGEFGSGRSLVWHADVGGASRFFYVAKASREERDRGLEGMPRRKTLFANGTHRRCPEHGAAVVPHTNQYTCGCAIAYGAKIDREASKNTNPCVKPIGLTRWLARLKLPPPRSAPKRLLVTYAGSGSEMIGGLLAGWDEVVGIERELEFVEIARARVALAATNPRAFEPFAKRAPVRVAEGQASLFGEGTGRR